MNKGLISKYKIDTNYFRTGCFYQLIIDENTSRIGILIESADDHVIFRILDGLRFTEDVTFTIPDLINYMNGKIIRMKPDHANGIFKYESINGERR